MKRPRTQKNKNKQAEPEKVYSATWVTPEVVEREREIARQVIEEQRKRLLEMYK